MNLAPVFRSQTRQVEQIDACMFVQKCALCRSERGDNSLTFRRGTCLAPGRCVDQQYPVFGIIPMSPEGSMYRIHGIDPSMGELIVRVGVSLPHLARARRLSRVEIAVPGGIGHFVQLSLQRAKSWS